MNVPADALVMLEALPEPAFLLERDGTVAAASLTARQLTPRDIGGRQLVEFHVGDKESFRTYLERCWGSRNVLVGSLHLHAHGTPTRFQCHGSRVALSAGAAVLVRLVQTDERFRLLTAKIRELNGEVKQRRHAEAVLNEALKDRELLLRELQHRVKNNMHMLAALLGGMERESTSPEAKAALRDAVIRFGAVSAVQQLLYGSNLEAVPAEELVATVMKSARSLAPDGVEIALKAESFSVPIKIATSVALVLNEILTNAIKYGRPFHSPQRIRVECSNTGDRMRIVVTDNGPGFSIQEASKRASGIGLVRGLLRQLGGSFAVEQDRGTRVRLELPLPKATNEGGCR